MKYKIIAAYVAVGTIFLFLLLTSHYYMQKDIEEVRKELEIGDAARLERGIVDLIKNDHDVRSLISSIVNKDEQIDHAAVEESIKKYIQQNPEALDHSLKGYYKRQDEEKQKQKHQQLLSMHSEVYDYSQPIVGLKEQRAGAKVVVAFVDPFCGYCRHGFSEMKQLVAGDANLAIIHRWLPVLGQPSVVAAKFMMAVYHLDVEKYLAFLDLFAKEALPESYDAFLEIAAKAGIDRAKLDEFMRNEEEITKINKKLQENIRIAEKIGIAGVPYYIVEDRPFEVALLNEQSISQAFSTSASQSQASDQAMMMAAPQAEVPAVPVPPAATNPSDLGGTVIPPALPNAAAQPYGGFPTAGDNGGGATTSASAAAPSSAPAVPVVPAPGAVVAPNPPQFDGVPAPVTPPYGQGQPSVPGLMPPQVPSPAPQPMGMQEVPPPSAPVPPPPPMG